MKVTLHTAMVDIAHVTLDQETHVMTITSTEGQSETIQLGAKIAKEDILEFQDGTSVSLEEFSKVYGFEDILTAAGPAPAPDSTGINSYDDGSGEILHGVDRLDSLGKFAGDGNKAQLSADAEFVTSAGLTEDAGTTLPLGGSPGDEEDEKESLFYSRVTLGNVAAGSATVFQLTDHDGNILQDVSHLAIDSDPNGHFTITVGQDGVVSLTLTEKGAAALAAGGGVLDDLLLPIRNMETGEITYVHVVATKGAVYDAAAQEAALADAGMKGVLENEWASVQGGLHGETASLKGILSNTLTVTNAGSYVNDGYFNVTAGVSGQSSIAMAHGKGSLQIEAEGNDQVPFGTTKVTAGIYAGQTGDSIHISGSDAADNLGVSVQGNGGTAVGIGSHSYWGNPLLPVAGGGVSIEKIEDVRIQVATTGQGSSFGIESFRYAPVRITNADSASKIDVESRSEATAFGVYGEGLHLAAGTIGVDTSVLAEERGASGSYAAGMYLGREALVEVDRLIVSADVANVENTRSVQTAAAIDMVGGGKISQFSHDGRDMTIQGTATSDMGETYGLRSTGPSGTHNAIHASGDLDFALYAESSGSYYSYGNAYGIKAGTSNANTGKFLTIDADGDMDASVTAISADKSAYGIHNTFDTVKIHADGKLALELSASTGSTSAKDMACGMFAHNQGHTIISSDTALEVSIVCQSGAGAKAFAMYASGQQRLDGYGGTNELLGGSEGDSIEIKGNVHAEFGGKNSISTGAGDDIVTIQGNITGTGTSIDTGSGSDLIILDGKVAVGSLSIQAGEGDYDVLVLTASNAGVFEALYKSWLTDLLTQANHGLEAIKFAGETSESLEWLNQLCQQHGLDFIFQPPAESLNMAALLSEDSEGVVDALLAKTEQQNTSGDPCDGQQEPAAPEIIMPVDTSMDENLDSQMHLLLAQTGNH